MGGARKKVIVRLLKAAEGPSLLPGYLPSLGLLDSAGEALDLLDPAGRLLTVPLQDVRYVAYVRDFNLDDEENPERLLRKTFLARPRMEGLWVRMTFRDGDVVEGLAGLGMAFLEDASTDRGIYVIPPEVRSNTQRLYIPTTSLSQMQLVGVVTTPSKVEKPKKPEKFEGTGRLFS